MMPHRRPCAANGPGSVCTDAPIAAEAWDTGHAQSDHAPSPACGGPRGDCGGVKGNRQGSLAGRVRGGAPQICETPHIGEARSYALPISISVPARGARTAAWGVYPRAPRMWGLVAVRARRGVCLPAQRPRGSRWKAVYHASSCRRTLTRSCACRPPSAPARRRPAQRRHRPPRRQSDRVACGGGGKEMKRRGGDEARTL